MKNLTHSASFHSGVKNAPSKPGIKHLADPFVAADIVRVIQAGDVFDEQNRFKTVFVDVGTTVQRTET